MPASPAPIIFPLPIKVVRAYLVASDLVTAMTGQRIGDRMPDDDVSPRFPAIRLTEVTTTEMVRRVWTRTLLQADCWGTTQPEADHLGRVLVGVLRESANFSTSEAVLGESDGFAVHPMPDESVNPFQPRAIVTGHIYLRPN